MSQDERVFRAQRGADDPLFVFPGFKMRVREAEEDVGELAAVEEVGEEFHCVGAEDGDVLVGCKGRGGGGVCVMGVVVAFCIGWGGDEGVLREPLDSG